MSPSLLIAFPHIIYILKPLKNHLIRYYHARFGEFYVSQHTGLVWVMTHEHSLSEKVNSARKLKFHTED